MLSKLDTIYHLNHSRDGVVMFDLATGEMTEGIGHYTYERVGEREVLMLCDNPTPAASTWASCTASPAASSPG